VRIFRYLKQDPDRGIVYTRPKLIHENGIFSPEGPLLNGSADSSFADAPSKKSTLGQVYWFLGALIDWKSKTSTRVLDSSTDAECCSLVMFGKENSWVRDFLKELGTFVVNKPTPRGEPRAGQIVRQESMVTSHAGRIHANVNVQ